MIQLMFAGLLLCAPAQDVNLLYAVPEDAQMVFSIRSMGTLERSLSESSWGKFLEDPAMKSWIDNFKGLLEIEENEEMKALSPKDLYQSIAGGLAGFLLIESEERAGGALLAVPGEKRDAFDEYLSEKKDLILETEHFVDSSDAYGDVDILILEPKKEDSTEPCLFIAEGEEVVAIVIHTEREAGLVMTQTLFDALKGEGADASILDARTFTEAREQYKGPGDLECFVDLQKIISILAEEEEIPEFLGVEALSHGYITGRVGRGEAIELSTFFGIEGEGMIRDLVDGLRGDSAQEMLEYIPAEAASAQAFFVDFNGIYQRIMEEIRAQSEEEYEQFRGMYDEAVVKSMKIDPEKELLGRLDGRLAVFTVDVPEEEGQLYLSLGLGAAAVSSQTAPSQGFIYLLGIEDAQGFQADFEKMLRALGVYVTLKKEEFQGQMIYSIQLPMAGLRLYWVFSEDVFGLSIFPTPVRAYLRLRTHGDQPTVEDNDDFAPLIRKNRGASSLSLTRTADMVQAMMGTLQNFMSLVTITIDMEGQEEVEEEKEPLTLPALEVFEKYFNSVIGWFVTVDERGILVKMTVE
jgi:hypothetical protein